jgi:hypothetical protein
MNKEAGQGKALNANLSLSYSQQKSNEGLTARE